MALILDESFTTGIPGSFATVRPQAGTLVVSYNATEQAVDLSNTSAGFSLWDITSQTKLTAGEFEVDLEFRSDSSGPDYRYLGPHMVEGAATISDGISVLHGGSGNSGYYSYRWTAPVWTTTFLLASTNTGGDLPLRTAGDRRTFNIRWDTTQVAGSPKVLVEVRVDGNLIHTYNDLTYTSFRPGIIFYQAAVRLHSIKMWDAPQSSLTSGTERGIDAKLGKLTTAPPQYLAGGAPPTVGLLPVMGSRNVYFGGNGRITGTVKEKALPSNLPMHRKVLLFDERSKILVREVWSDPATGEYSFDEIAMGRSYTIISYDYTGAYRAVIADVQYPELIV